MKKSIPTLERKLWKVFSDFIRTRDKWTCLTCGKYEEGRGMHAGHFHDKSISNPELYFHPRNVHAQCVACNLYRSGNKAIYATRLVERYSPEILQELLVVKNSQVKWNRNDYEIKIEEFKEKLKNVGSY